MFRQAEELQELAQKMYEIGEDNQAKIYEKHATSQLSQYGPEAESVINYAAGQVDILTKLAMRSEARDEPRQASVYRKHATKLIKRYKLDQA
jgi:hypothetical protein